MSTSVIEAQRQTHLALETYEQALTHLLAVSEDNYKLHRERLAAKHQASHLLDRIVDRSSELRLAYKDNVNGSHPRQSEMENIANGGIAEFYNRLAALKEYHRKFPENASRVDEEEKVDYSSLFGAGFVDGRDCKSS